VIVEAADEIGDGVSILAGAVEQKVGTRGEGTVWVVLYNVRAGIGPAEDPRGEAGGEGGVGDVAVAVDCAADCWRSRSGGRGGRRSGSRGGSCACGWCWLRRSGGRQEAGTPDEAVVGAAVGGVLGPAGIGGWDPGDVDAGLGLCAE